MPNQIPSDEVGEEAPDPFEEKKTSPAHPSQAEKKSFSPPRMNASLQMKWGLALLGKERATQYLDWLRTRLEQSSR